MWGKKLVTETNFAAALPTPQQPARVSDVASWAVLFQRRNPPPLTLPWKVRGIEMVLHFLGPQEGNMRAPCNQQAQQGDP